MKAPRRKLRPLLLFILPLGMMGCSKYYGCDPEMDCQSDRPEAGSIHLLISAPAQGDSVLIELREGSWNDGTTVLRSKRTENTEFEGAPEHRYSAKAFYPNGGDTLTRSDSGRLKLEDQVNCDEVCYRVEDLELNLEKAD